MLAAWTSGDADGLPAAVKLCANAVRSLWLILQHEACTGAQQPIWLPAGRFIQPAQCRDHPLSHLLLVRQRACRLVDARRSPHLMSHMNQISRVMEAR